MENSSKSNPFSDALNQAIREGSIPPRYLEIVKEFHRGYRQALEDRPEEIDTLFVTLLQLIKEQVETPFHFAPYHERVRAPFDYYQFGLNLIGPLINLPRSTVQGKEHLKSITESLAKGENAIFLANHQTEADPQAISVLLQDSYPQFAEEMIFVAGERVTTDPLAVPASRGCNLLCIYSKRYIDTPPENKAEKQRHNRKTMELMSELLSQGGKAIYVAPSGGRDRPNKDGIVEVANFDPQSIEMFYLMAQKAGHPTHFYPLTLKTYELLPPPQVVQSELGEDRIAKCVDIHMAFGPRIDMTNFPGSDLADKHERRAARAEYICNLVRHTYTLLP